MASILQVIDERGRTGVMVLTRNVETNQVSAICTAFDPDDGSVDTEKFILAGVFDEETRYHPDVRVFNEAKVPSDV